MTSVSQDNFSTADPYVGRAAPWSQEAEQAVDLLLARIERGELDPAW